MAITLILTSPVGEAMDMALMAMVILTPIVLLHTMVPEAISPTIPIPLVGDQLMKQEERVLVL